MNGGLLYFSNHCLNLSYPKLKLMGTASNEFTQYREVLRIWVMQCMLILSGLIWMDDLNELNCSKFTYQRKTDFVRMSRSVVGSSCCGEWYSLWYPILVRGRMLYILAGLCLCGTCFDRRATLIQVYLSRLLFLLGPFPARDRRLLYCSTTGAKKCHHHSGMGAKFAKYDVLWNENGSVFQDDYSHRVLVLLTLCYRVGQWNEVL